MISTTTCGRRWGLAVLALCVLGTVGCQRSPAPGAAQEPETVARTEFTDRIENFFEYVPLAPGRPSQFLIHLTDLVDGSPVEKAEVMLTVRPGAGGGAAMTTKAKVGRVTGIYVAEVTVPAAGEYAIDFHVKNAKLDERMALTGFEAR